MSSKIFFWLLTTILIITSIAYAETLTRTDGNIGLSFTTNDFYNPYVKSSNYSSYNYEIANAPYKIYFKSNSNLAEPLRFEKDGYFFIYDISQGEMTWNGQAGFPSRTDTLGSGASSNSLDTTAVFSNKTLTYPTAFYNTNVSYLFGNNMIKETFILAGVPSFKAYNYLQYSGNIKFNASLKICTEQQCFIPSGTQDDFETSGKIFFKDTNNKTIFYLDSPIATDKNNITIPLLYSVHGSNAQMNFWLRINRTWLETATFPIIIDPTIIVVDEINATILILPETNECYGLDCGSTIKIVNSGNNNITFNSADLTVSIEGSEYNKLYFYNEATQNDVFASDEYDITLIPNQELEFGVYSKQISAGTWKYNVSFNYLNHTYLVDPYYVAGNSTGENTTTGTTPLNKTILNISVSSTKPYAILVSSEVSGDSLTSNSFSDLFLDSVTISQNSEESKDSTSSNFYPSKAMLWVGNLSAGTHTAITRYWSLTSGVLTRIRNSYISAIELPTGSEYASSTTNTSYSTSLTSRLNKNFNVATEGNYWIFGSAISDTDGTATVDLRVDNINYVNAVWSPKDARDYTGFFGQKIINLSSGSHSMSIFGSSTITGADRIRDMNLMAVPLSNSIYWYNETISETSTGSATFVNSTNLTFNVISAGDYLIVATGIFGSNSATKSGEVTLVVDGIQYCDVIRETLALANRYPFMCQKSLNLSSGVHTANIQYREAQSGTAYIKETTLLVLGKTDKPCNPRLNEDWVISDAQVCDNKQVTTGTGKINITETGSLELKNNAMVNTTAVSPFLHPTSSIWKILVEHGSNLFPRG